MKQDEIYRDELGPKPKMVHEKGDACWRFFNLP